MSNKVRGDKMQFVCIVFHYLVNICRKFEFNLISQGSVATCLRCGGYRFCSKFQAFCSSAKFLKIG